MKRIQRLAQRGVEALGRYTACNVILADTHTHKAIIIVESSKIALISINNYDLSIVYTHTVLTRQLYVVH